MTAPNDPRATNTEKMQSEDPDDHASQRSLTNDPESDSMAYHVPVLLPEVLEHLSMEPNGVYVDATLGGGGYSEAMLRESPTSRVLGFDTDPYAMAFATKRLAPFGDRFQLVAENFGDLQPALEAIGISRITGIVYDLGVSSHQLDTTSIGLSYRIEAPLDMRLDPRLALTAQEVIDTYDDYKLRKIFREYGEENYAGPIARAIIRAREKAPIRTTTALAAVITEGIPEPKRNATLSRIFQALRIEVNGELDNLRRSLEQAVELLAPQGRIVVVSYHSLEDRIVKDFFKEQSSPRTEAGSLQALKENIDHARVRLTLLNRKPLVPTEEEISRNVRARSAKLRAAVRTDVA